MKHSYLTQWAVIVFCVFSIVNVLNSQIIANSESQAQDLFSLSLDELMNVEVVITTAGKQAEMVKDIPASVVVITRENIETYGYTTIQEILQHVPGMYMIDDYFWRGAENFGVRGFFSTGPFNDMIIMVNGINQIEDLNGSYSLAKINVPVEAIDRIEVIRGPMSVMYGSGAFFGAINIITTQKESGNNTHMAAGSYGTNETSKLFFRSTQKSENGYISLNLSGFQTAGVNEPFKKMTSDIPNVILSAGLEENTSSESQLTNHKKYAGISGKYNSIKFDFSYNETQKGIIDAYIASGNQQKGITKATNIAVAYDKDISNRLSFLTRFGYFHYDYLLDYHFGYDSGISHLQDLSSAYELETDIFFNLSRNLDATLGFYLRRITEVSTLANLVETFSVKYQIPPQDNCISKAVFAQINWEPISRLQIIAGSRLEHLSSYNSTLDFYTYPDESYGSIPGNIPSNGVQFIPRFAAIYELFDKHYIKLLYGRAIKVPSIYQSMENNFLSITLEPGYISTMELNYLASLSSKYSINLSLIKNAANNLISRSNDISFLHTMNSGKISTFGIEFGLDAQPVTPLNFHISACYYDSKNKQAGKEGIELGYAPKFLGYLRSSLRLTQSSSISISGRYISTVESKWMDPNLVMIEPPSDDNPLGEFENQPARLGDAIDAYSVWDTNFRINKIGGTGIYSNLKISNIFDTEIRYPVTESNVWADRGTIGMGRTVNLGFGIEF